MILADVLSNLIAILVSIFAVVFVYFKWSFQHWKKKNIPYLDPRIPYGNVADAILSKKNLAITINEIYEKMKRNGWKHGGIYFFTSPTYVPINLEYLKNIMSKDFQYFTDRIVYYNEKEDPLEAHLVNLGGTEWKNMRTKLTPTFTSAKMKTMFQIVVDCCTELIKKIDVKSSKNEAIDIKDVLSRFTTEIIGSCAFGLECKSFEDENSLFRVYGKRIFFVSTIQELKRKLCLSFPKVGEYLNIYQTPKDITHFFVNLVKDTVEFRKKNNYVRSDFLQLLIDVKNAGNLTTEQVAAQCFIFFLAGFETSSSLMTFSLYELAKHQDIQEKVRDEIGRVLAKYDGKVTYEALLEMKYLNQVIDETLRMYPPLPLMNRKCVKDYKIPGEDIIIEKGTRVFIPIMAIHYDEEYYPDPEKFDPERFSEENKNSRHAYAHIPFGEGPRNCIGKRFAMMQVRVGLSGLLKNFKFTVNQKTVEPFEMEPNTNILSVVGEIWLNVEKL